MTQEAQRKPREPLFKIVKRGAHKTFTFLGVPANSILIFFAVVLLLLNIVPIIQVFVTAFTAQSSGDVPVDWFSDDIWNMQYLAEGTPTGYYWYQLFCSETARGNFWLPFGRSILVSVLSCVFSILFGGITAFLICRTNMPLKRFISAVFIFPYIMPQWTLALFWKNFFISTSCTSGYVGEFQALTGIAVPEWFVYGAFPISIVLGLHYAPFAYILIGGVLRNMDSNLEEAAVILNIPKWKRFTRVTIPMLKPALLSTILLVFSSAISSYAVPVTLGNPTNYFLLATKMKSMIEGSGGLLQGQGAIVSIVLILIGMIMLFLNQLQTGSRKQYTTVTGKSGQISKQNLGKVMRWVIGIILSIIVVFFCIGPMVSFFFESLLPNPGDYSSGFTWKAWFSQEVIRNDVRGIFYEERVWTSLRGSIILSVSCALLAGTCGILIGYAVSRKRKSKLASMVNGLAFFPYLMPSISLSLIFLLLAVQIPWLYKNIMIVMVIVGTIKYIPFASRTSLNAMLQLSNEIEEAAVIQHIPWWKRMTRVIFPIQKSAFISGYLLPFISCMRELALFIFLGGDSLILTRYMFFLEDTGVAALENAANLLLVIIILVVNFLVNLLTGASIDKGIGGNEKNA